MALAIGLRLTLIHLISIPVTNTSVNPARSTGVAVFAGGWAIEPLWLFWVAPIVGGVLGAAVYRVIAGRDESHFPESATLTRLKSCRFLALAVSRRALSASDCVVGGRTHDGYR